jgi:hypothetical protein
MYYIRKIKNSNLYKIKECESCEMIAADVLKQECNTTANTLSFWKCDSLTTMQDTIKAILLSTTSIETTQFIIIEDAQLEKFQIEIDFSELGKTGYLGFEKLHVNLCNLTYGKIGALLNIYKESVARTEFVPKLQKSDVKEYIREVKQAGLLNAEMVNPDLLKDINKFC